jgi:integrase
VLGAAPAWKEPLNATPVRRPARNGTAAAPAQAVCDLARRLRSASGLLCVDFCSFFNYYLNSLFARGLKVMAKSHLKLVGPNTVKRTVTPRRRPNAELRSREYLTEAEIEKLMKVARDNRYGHRDATMVLVAYRHGFRASELVDLRWDQIDFATATMAVRRAKRGTPATHPIRGDESRALRKLQRDQEPKSPFVFTSERGSPFTTAGFARMLERAGEAAGFKFKAHPHMLRHACGFTLANKGHDTRALQAYLGHRNIQHTVRYTELAPDRFKDFWR